MIGREVCISNRNPYDLGMQRTKVGVTRKHPSVTATNFIQLASNAIEPTSRCSKCSGCSWTSSYYRLPNFSVKILRRKPVGSLFSPEFSLKRSPGFFITETAIQLRQIHDEPGEGHELKRRKLVGCRLRRRCCIFKASLMESADERRLITENVKGKAGYDSTIGPPEGFRWWQGYHEVGLSPDLILVPNAGGLIYRYRLLRAQRGRSSA
ncbi:uncharacterized protein LACBIDRAFT_329119 [Laccaria bicolor S238N-H82]|uniref:Predicted protein n=1 Tax=Laccaria bicolor (strain S238N-H82 / ATCC MYA-4686) TaxID=486041 RepID=B0DH49_LACBS|nr:uncharacterized protein LACBIDRAFT_329119 [Laccaria bicolor S238N-H82]EDR06049.1 predicted protein [Laccaria bicolor S238N-H82]|eukprot:XP_001883337.1 predicted protein [Laccaria bicolor S238N-H82]